jgi:starch phosphorylase
MAKKIKKETPAIPMAPTIGMNTPIDTLVKKGMDVPALKLSFAAHLKYTLAKDRYNATLNDQFQCLAFMIRDRLMERWIKTQQTYHSTLVKRVYYLSLEFLMGRTLGNAIMNLGLDKEVENMISEVGLDLEEIEEAEQDPGLGNGGLGRLAACFLDSMATMQIPCHGYGLRYEYGIFNQEIVNGYQVEKPETWLRLGNPWEIARPEFTFTVKFYGRVESYVTREGKTRFQWVDTNDVLAVPYDTPIPGFHNNTVNNLRLWAAKSTNEFDLDYFNTGDYLKAIAEKVDTENISKVLYPNDNNFSGKELRVKQQYLFVSASLQDILRRYKLHSSDLKKIPEHIAIQLNDTHPTVAIPEFMRLLIDEESLSWDTAWEITTKVFAYTNHTLLSEALETWPVSLYENLLPRHLQIIFEINHRFLKQVALRYPGDLEKLRQMSIIEENGEKKIRMAYLSIVGSHSTNGVAVLHTELLKNQLVRNFYEMFPERFNNKTNGITQRRWLRKCNPDLSELLTEKIGSTWVTNLDDLKQLIPYQNDSAFLEAWQKVKQKNKNHLADTVKKETGIIIDPHTLFDVQVKRMHEYKRQLLLTLYAIHSYTQLKENPHLDWTPRTIFFGGKAAPGYFMAKLIIKLITNVGTLLNSDPQTNERLKLVFLPNYRVSLAEKIIPGTDLSEQISTAGKEASGTGNMKFALNGALIIGTMDGANIEIRKEVGADNIFIFGLHADAVEDLKNKGYDPSEYIEKNPALQKTLNLIECGFFSLGEGDIFKPIVDHLRFTDTYMLMADFDAYVEAQTQVQKVYRNKTLWTKKSLLNVANMGYFSSDRTILEYSKNIWKTNPISIAGI